MGTPPVRCDNTIIAQFGGKFKKKIPVRQDVKTKSDPFLSVDRLAAVQGNEFIAHDLLHQIKCSNACAVTAVKDSIKL